MRSISFKTAKKRADKWFGRFIRLRDTIIIDDGRRVGSCSTCPKILNIYDLQCGHFQQRDHLPTRWDEKNCHAQCPKCNKWKAGEQFIMSRYIDKKYGDGAAEKLEEKARKKTRFAKMYPKHLLLQVANKYKKKCERIAKGTLNDNKWSELLSEWR